MKRYYVRASFDPSMPDWFKREIQGKDYRNSVLRNALIKKGIALSSVKFLDHDPGVSSAARPVYLLQSDYGTYVYVPGVNDDDTAYFNNRSRKFGSIAKSKLPELAADVVWMDMMDEGAKFSKKRYQDPRYTYRYSSRGDYAGQYRRKDYLGEDESGEAQYSEEYWTPEGKTPSNESRARDKSGYKVPSPEEMITSFYEKYPKRLTDKVEDIYQEIIDAREEIFAYDFRALGDSDRYSSRVENSYRYLSDAIGKYRDMLGYIRDIQKYSARGYTPDSYTLRSVSDSITYIRKRLNDAINLLYPSDRA